MNPPLVLASTSRYRRDLLSRLGLPFAVARPDTDESPLPGETPSALALRLAEAKARAVAGAFPCSLVIGSDQVAEMDGRIFGKPGDHARAVAQLKELSGRTVSFFTALCLLDTRSGEADVRGVPTRVSFRVLDEASIERYLAREPAYDCAGSAKSEGLGIALLDRIEGDDPNALVGLPLIALCDMLRRHNISVP
ncbi:MAG: septum formation inhibitor Maf [Betaproteobacteria bacterium]|nr:septum formation inhibitor Maf [Betaproteobacteria bacterium]